MVVLYVPNTVIIERITKEKNNVFAGNIYITILFFHIFELPQGRFVGRVMVRATGSFDIKTTDGKLVTVKEQYCRLLQANSGYHYTMKRAIPLGH